MSARAIAVLLAGIAATHASGTARADDDHALPDHASFTTRAITPLNIEGLSGDRAGNLYTTGREVSPTPCPIWRIDRSGSLVVVGLVPNATGCGPTGLTFDAAGDLYVGDGGTATVWRVTPNATTPQTATAFATGVPGTNGLAFDRHGNLWTSDGATAQGRVWRIDRNGGTCEAATGAFVGCVEAFRIQPMRNGSDLGGALPAPGVGRQNNSVTPNTAQNIVANGVAFNREGDLFVADTARGAIWRVELRGNGTVKSATGCDTTFTADTLCLDNLLVAHPYLEGADGIALDREGNIWTATNERNAIVVVTRHGVVEVFRNPANATGLRNASDTSNNHILEFPTSPFLAGRTFCATSSDGNRRDNAPNSAGEVNAGGPVGARGKISCLDQPLRIPGLPLPVD
ncbi:MAG TPA: SMP-30/gluconolactonase/LRE family protein [Kofleriaceae bacterium]